jgi:Arc/MetJ family transcription regulator
MRTNIEIDDELIQRALRVSGLKTKRAVVEAGLRMLLRLKRQEDILRLVGKVHGKAIWTRAVKAVTSRDPRRQLRLDRSSE